VNIQWTFSEHSVNVAEFWRRYNGMPADERHHYEIIREGRPCHLYFDLEYALGGGLNAQVDGSAAVRGNDNNNNNNNNKHAYAGTNDRFPHLKLPLVLKAPRHCGPI
jgi:hypothetical protein